MREGVEVGNVGRVDEGSWVSGLREWGLMDLLRVVNMA
mgnify:CR=1 FL=1